MTKHDGYEELRQHLREATRECRTEKDARQRLDDRFEENARWNDPLASNEIWVYGRLYLEDEFFEQVDKIIDERKPKKIA